MKFPSEAALWKTASIGFGLILGVAIIAIMNQINYMFYPVEESLNISKNDELIADHLSNPALLAGKLISITTGCFFAAAITKLIKPDITKTSALIIGSILMVLGIFDLLSSLYPAYFNVISLIIYLPAALLGYQFISNFQKNQFKHDTSNPGKKKSENR